MSQRLGFEMLHHPPKKFFGHLGRSLPIGMGQTVAAGRGGSVNRRERSRTQPELVAQVIQSDAMAQLRVQQTHHVASRVKRAGLIRRARLPRNLGGFMLWNEIANLARDVKPPRVGLILFLFMPALWQVQGVQPTLFSISCGMGVEWLQPV
ncbi:MAG: hypothetical protein KGJ60_04015 [Verrucomicrobiota bacterium]|nr:hypothetical protein [Verrucomicrobiota bacterium]